MTTSFQSFMKLSGLTGLELGLNNLLAASLQRTRERGDSKDQQSETLAVSSDQQEITHRNSTLIKKAFSFSMKERSLNC